MVAQCFVRCYPERVEQLILASTAAPDKNYLPRASRQKRLISLFPTALLRSISVRRVLSILATMPENERAFWSALIREQVMLSITKQWLMSQYELIADYCAHY